RCKPRDAGGRGRVPVHEPRRPPPIARPRKDHDLRFRMCAGAMPRGDLHERRDSVRRDGCEVIVKPHVDWFALAPSLSLISVSFVLLLVAVLVPRGVRKPVSAFLAFEGFVTSLVFAIV